MKNNTKASRIRKKNRNMIRSARVRPTKQRKKKSMKKKTVSKIRKKLSSRKSNSLPPAPEFQKSYQIITKIRNSQSSSQKRGSIDWKKRHFPEFLTSEKREKLRKNQSKKKDKTNYSLLKRTLGSPIKEKIKKLPLLKRIRYRNMCEFSKPTNRISSGFLNLNVNYENITEDKKREEPKEQKYNLEFSRKRKSLILNLSKQKEFERKKLNFSAVSKYKQPSLNQDPVKFVESRLEEMKKNKIKTQKKNKKKLEDRRKIKTERGKEKKKTKLRKKKNISSQENIGLSKSLIDIYYGKKKVSKLSKGRRQSTEKRRFEKLMEGYKERRYKNMLKSPSKKKLKEMKKN